jgi:LuxR family maltose regulon positive regulatory protein
MYTKPRLLQRDNINEALKSTSRFQLSVISAPMGYGKTTAVREFFRKNDISHSWLCLNGASANNGYFWEQLIRQLPEDFKKMKNDLQGVGFPSENTKMARVIETFSEISNDKDFYLVFDDYHYAENDLLNHFVETITKSEIQNFHLMIVSRHLPKINISELSLKDLAIQIDIELFRFTNEDVRRYFTLMNFPMKKADIANIQYIAEGWISAIYLIYRGLRSGIPLQNITAVETLLKTAIFDAYNDETKTALCALATLKTFTLDLADRATGINGIIMIIKELYRENAFIEWDERSGVYTIHSVFARFLKVEASLYGLDLKEINKQAGIWYLDHHDFTQAFRYLIRGEAYDTLLEVLERPALYISANDRPILFQAFDQIPQELKDCHPIALVKYILIFVITGNRKRGLELLNQFESDLFRNNYHVHFVEIQAAIHVIKVFLNFNDANVMKCHIDAALELLNGENCVICSSQGPFSFGSPHFTFIYYKEVGAYKKTSEISLEKYAQLSWGNGTGADVLSLAEYSLETGNFSVVEDAAYKAIYRAKTQKQHSIEVCASLTLARLYLLQDKYEEALLLLSDLSEEVASNAETILLDTYDLCLGYFYACTGEIKKIPNWIKEGDMTVNSLLFQGLVFSYIVYGKILILLGDWVKAEALCETFTPYFDVFHNQLGYLHNYIHLSIAAHKQGNNRKAKMNLSNALKIGHADNIVTPFIENSALLLPLLNDMTKEDFEEMGYIKRITNLCTDYSPLFTRTVFNKNPLSHREMEVIELLSNGLSRIEIAEKMYLSTGTIRSHIQNIYIKLNVNKKGEALKKAIEMGIIS